MKHIKKLWLLLLLPVVIGLLVNWLTPINIPGSIWAVIKWIGSLFVSKFTLPVWAILFLMLALPTLILVAKALSRHSHMNYVSDKFFDIMWHWQYVRGKLDVRNFVPRCPVCTCILEIVEEWGEDDIILLCHHCGFKKKFEVVHMDTLLDQVKREIDLKITTGKYLKD